MWNTKGCTVTSTIYKGYGDYKIYEQNYLHLGAIKGFTFKS